MFQPYDESAIVQIRGRTTWESDLNWFNALPTQLAKTKVEIDVAVNSLGKNIAE